MLKKFSLIPLAGVESKIAITLGLAILGTLRLSLYFPLWNQVVGDPAQDARAYTPSPMVIWHSVAMRIPESVGAIAHAHFLPSMF